MDPRVLASRSRACAIHGVVARLTSGFPWVREEKGMYSLGGKCWFTEVKVVVRMDDLEYGG
mgnify:CR=1 FL=1